MRTMLAIHCTYPTHPSSAKDTIIARKPEERDQFQSLESVFRQFAEELGWDASNGRFCQNYGDFGGVRKNLSSFIIPLPGGEHYRIAFYT